MTTTEVRPTDDTEVPVREGVYGERVLAVEPGGVEFIAAEERHGRPRQLAWTWTAPNLEFATVYVGVLPVALFGAQFWPAVLGVLIGSALGAATHGVLSTFGPRYGVAQLVQSRAAFGLRGNLLPAALNTITSGAGWVAVNSVSGALALQTLANLVGVAQPPFALALGAIVLVEVAVAVLGYNLVHRLEGLLTPLLAVIFGLCCVAIFTAAHPGTAANGATPGGTGAFILAIFSAYAYAASWNPYACDYSRYLPEATSRRAVAWAAGGGLFVSCAVLEVAGAALATVSGTRWGADDNPTTQFVLPLSHNLAVAATIGIALGAIAANVLNLYSGAMSFLTLGIRLHLRASRALVAAGFGILGFLVGLTGSTGPGSKFESFLFFNTYWIAPFVAVVLTEHLLRRGRYRPSEFFSSHPPVRPGLVAMIGGIVASVPFWNQPAIFVGSVAANAPQLGDISVVVGFVVAAGLHTALRRMPSHATP